VAVFGRFDFVLHFHGFDDEDALVRGYGVAFFGEDAHDAAWHGGSEDDRAVGAGVAAAGAQGAGIVNAVGDALRADVERGVGVVGVEDDAIRLARDEKRENAGADEVDVGSDRLAIDKNAPLTGGIGGVELDLSGAAVDFEVKVMVAQPLHVAEKL
jgi:hypothetical protein